jgi:hypothetical protein
MKVSSLRWGLILLGIGLIFLAINLGYLSHHVWWSLLTLWPVFLIAIGIELIFRRTRLRWLALLSPLLIVIAFAYAVITDNHYDSCEWPRSFGWNDSQLSRETRHFEYDRNDSLTNLQVDFEFTAGEIWVGPTSRLLFSGDFEYWRNEPTCNYERDGDSGKITIRSADHGNLGFIWNRRTKNDARIFLGDYLPLDLSLKSAAASVDLDLSELIVNKLSIEAGASNVELKLGCRASEIMVRIDSGASKVRLDVPGGIGLKIRMDTALSSTNFRRLGLNKTSEGYESADYGASVCKAIVELDSGVSRLEIDYY